MPDTSSVYLGFTYIFLWNIVMFIKIKPLSKRAHMLIEYLSYVISGKYMHQLCMDLEKFCDLHFCI